MATLNTLAQVSGGLFATLVTVVVFAVGLSAGRPDGGWMYMPFVARRHHVFVIGALTAALALANAVLPSVSDLVGSGCLQYLLWLNALLMPMAVLLSIWLMCRVIESASGSDFDATRSVLRFSMNRIASSTRRLDDVANAFLAAITDSPVKFNQWAGFGTLAANAEQQFFGPNESRLVVDADLEILAEIRAVCNPLADRVEFSILAAPSLGADSRGVLHAKLKPSDNPSAKRGGRGKQSAMAPPAPIPIELRSVVDASVRERLNALCARLFVYAERPNPDLRQFFDRMQSELNRLARASDSVSLKARLTEFRELLDDWLAIAGADAAPRRPRLLSLRHPRFLGPLEIDVSELVRATAQANDFATFEQVVDGVSGMMVDADEHKAVAVFDDCARMLGFAFYLSVNSPMLGKQSMELFDRRVDSLLSVRKSLTSLSLVGEDDAETAMADPAERALTYAVVGTVVAMIRRAMECGNVEMAGMLVQRLTRQHHASSRLWYLPAQSQQVDRADALIAYSLVVIVGWGLHVSKAGRPEQQTAAKQVLNDTLKLLPPRHVLISLWEFYHGDNSPRSAVDTALGVAHWDLGDDERRTGFVYSGGGDSWIQDGLWLGMLRTRDPNTSEVRQFFRSVPSRWLWKLENLETRLSGLQGAFGADSTTEEATKARRAVIAMVGQRHRHAEVSALREIAEAALRTERVAELKSSVTNAVDHERKWPFVLATHAPLAPSVQACPLPVRGSFSVPRESLVRDQSIGHLHSSWIATNMVQFEAMELIHTAEHVLPVEATVRLLLEVQSAIRTARDVLRQRGFLADLVIVPPLDCFARAIFRSHSLWEPSVGRRPEWDRISVGEWDGVTVVRCPYNNTSSILVAQSAALFGHHGNPSQSLAIDVTDATVTERQAFLAKLIDGTSEALPTSQELEVGLAIRLLPSTGVSEIEAGYRIDISEAGGCFAMEPYDNSYHRPTCEEVSVSDDLVLSDVPRCDGESVDREPCEKCRPDRPVREGGTADSSTARAEDSTRGSDGVSGSVSGDET